MNEVNLSGQIFYCVDQWADASLERAEKFVERHLEALKRGIGRSQLFGMLQSSFRGITQVFEYVQNRKLKASRAGFSVINDFFSEFLVELEFIQNEAKRLSNQCQTLNKEKLIKQLEIELTKKYIQHIIAHSMLHRA